MRQIDLQEYVPSKPYSLSSDEHDALRLALPSLTIQRVIGAEDTYTLTPGSTVGAVEVGGLSILIEPKIPIGQLLSLAYYAIGEGLAPKDIFKFTEENSLHDLLARELVREARRAFARGLLHGYRMEEEALLTVRGRIRFDDQVRRRFGIPLPVEVRYDEFTDDIRANQLVKAAVVRLGGMRLRSPDARRGLGWVAAMLENVSLEEYPPNGVPEVRFDRLNEHYRNVVTLARLVLRHGAFEAGRGAVRASGFLMDMNDVFQEFVTVALREQLRMSRESFGEGYVSSLDKPLPGEKGRISLKPDLVWREGSSYVFVGDAKYKNIEGGRVPNADLYQLLAYTTALDLPGGLLVYAKGEADTATYTVRHSGKRLEVAALDLSGTLEQVLERVGDLAGRVWALRSEARLMQNAA